MKGFLDMLPLAALMAGIFAAIFLVAWIVRALVRRARERSLHPIAASLSLTYVGRVPASRYPWLGRLTNYGSTDGSRADFVMQGAYASRPVVLVEHMYREFQATRKASQQRLLRETTAFFPGAAKDLPDFAVIPADQAEAGLGVDLGTDVEVAGPDTFRREYRVRSKNAAASGSVPQAVVDYLAGRPGWSAQAIGGDLVVTRRGNRCRPEEHEAFLKVTSALADGFASRPAPPAPAARVEVSSAPSAAEARWADQRRIWRPSWDRNATLIGLVAFALIVLANAGFWLYGKIKPEAPPFASLAQQSAPVPTLPAQPSPSAALASGGTSQSEATGWTAEGAKWGDPATAPDLETLMSDVEANPSVPQCVPSLPVVMPDSIGPLWIGMTVQDLRRVCPNALLGYDRSDAGVKRPGFLVRFGDGGVVMGTFISDSLQRITYDTDVLRTDRGAFVGMRLDSLASIYGEPRLTRADCDAWVVFDSAPPLRVLVTGLAKCPYEEGSPPPWDAKVLRVVLRKPPT